MQIRIYEDKCCGAGTCSAVCPKYFDQREDDGIVVLLREIVSPEDEDMVRQVEEICPTQAIKVTS